MFQVQMMRAGEWVQQGRECATRGEAEQVLAFELAMGSACDGRDDYGSLLPNVASRIVEVQS